MATAPFPVDPVLTGIALAYRNEGYIADQVMPRVNPILGKEEFTYTRMTLAEGFTIPNTLVGRKSNPTEVEFTGTRVTGRTQDYGLDDVIPSNDMANAANGYDPRAFAVEGLADLIDQDREQRVANTVFANATYPAANRVTLSGTAQWSDQTNSNPLNAILAALDIPVLRPNIAVFGQATWTQLRQHPRIVTAIFGQTANAGAVSRQQVAELLELDEIIVGKSFTNSARRGQAPVLQRLWGKHAAFLRRDLLATSAEESNRITFGVTFQFGQRFAGAMEEPKIGLRGSTRVRVGESLSETVVANDVAYYFENAVA
jgi:hypothetical protein